MQIVCSKKLNQSIFADAGDMITPLNTLWNAQAINTSNLLTESGRPNKPVIKKRIKDVSHKYHGTTDLLLMSVAEENWTRTGSLGVKLGTVFGNTQVGLIRERGEAYKTVAHEFLHAARYYVYVHTGIKLETLFSVDSFTKLIHGDYEGYAEYEDYDEIFTEIAPSFNEAVRKDRQEDVRVLTGTALSLVRRLALNLSSELKEVKKKPNTNIDQDIEIVAKTVWGEAEGESKTGQRAVACVIKNRLFCEAFPDTYLDIVTEPLQFSAWNKGNPRRSKMANLDPQTDSTYDEIIDICRDVMQAEEYDITDGADHYEALAENEEPGWADDNRRTKRIGNHEFYKLRC